MTRQTLVSATVLIIGANLFSRLTGLFRETLIAAYFGAGSETDSYLVAFILPGVFAGILASILTTSLIPVFSEYYYKNGERTAWDFALNTLNIIGLFLCLVVILQILLAPLLVNLLAPGFQEDSKRLAGRLLRIMAPATLFLGLSGVLNAILHSYKHFISGVLSILFYNIGIIILIILLSKKLGIQGVAFGALVGAFLFFIFPFITFFRYLTEKRFYRLSVNFKNPGFLKFTNLFLPLLAVTSIVELNIIIDRVMASSLIPGSIAALNFANRLIQAPLAVFGIGLSSALFPTLAQKFIQGDLLKLREFFSASLRFLALVIIPIGIILIILAQPIVSLIFERGAFLKTETLLVSQALVFYGLGIFAQAGTLLVSRVFFSLNDTKTVLKFGVIATFVNILLNFILIQFLAHRGIALATSIAMTVQFYLLMNALRKKLGFYNPGYIIKSLVKITSCAALSGITIFVTFNHYRPDFGLFFTMLFSFGLGFLVYYLSCSLIGVSEVKKLFSVLGKIPLRARVVND